MTDLEKDRIVKEEVAAARNPRTRWALILVGLVSAAFVGLAIHDLFERADVAETETAAVSGDAEAVTDKLLPACRIAGPESRIWQNGTCAAAFDLQQTVDDAEVQDAEVDDPDPNDPDPDDPDPNDPDPNDPDRPNDPDPDDPDPDDPDPDDPENDDADPDDPENQEDETQDAEVDDPDPDDPDPDDPEQQDPEHDDPDPDDPDPNDPPPYPESFTFEFMGVTYVCTDPDEDRHYECQPA